MVDCQEMRNTNISFYEANLSDETDICNETSQNSIGHTNWQDSNGSNVQNENLIVRPETIKKHDIVTLTANGDLNRVEVLSRAGKFGKSGNRKYKHFFECAKQ